MDFRPGGSFHYQITSPDGLEMWGKWEFLDIVAPEKIVLLQSFSNAEEIATFDAGRDSMNQGWDGTFAQLDAYLEKETASV